jgi:hypothetical protein
MENSEVKSYQERINAERAQVDAGKITDILNKGGNSKLLLGEALTHEHRYLQQEFWTMVESFITSSANAHEEKRYDDRNAYTVKMCSKIAPLLDQFRAEIAKER